MPRGGTLSIETLSETFDGEARRVKPWAREGAYVLLRVSDVGDGMDAATLAHIFEPFFTTKGLGRGTGLGLATVYGIVEQHFGFIHVESQLGAGTAFNVYLPVAERKIEEVEEAAQDTAIGGGETVLIAEDEHAVLRALSTVLRSFGYTVLTASDGIEALQVFEANAATIDLVIADMMMPGISGREVMNRVREQGFQTPFLFSSGYSADAVHTDFVVHEGLNLIQKPYRKEALLQEVRRILDASATK